MPDTERTDADLLAEIELIEENLREVHAVSAYATRAKPELRKLRAEAKRRGLR